MIDFSKPFGKDSDKSLLLGSSNVLEKCKVFFALHFTIDLAQIL